jgi:DNA-nicking Smr family endonuclease
MSKKSGSGSKSPSSLSGEDIELWRHMTDDVDRYDGKDYERIAQEETPPTKEKPAIKETVTTGAPVKTTQNKRKGQGLDKRTEQRLRKGQMPIEARLDLHGMGQNEAHRALIAFITRSFEQQKRCVLVITGKGQTRSQQSADDHWLSPQTGVLRARTPDWLADDTLREYVLKTMAAQPKDGGDGALYVLLRRKRN